MYVLTKNSYNINSIEYNIYKYKGISNKGDAFEDRYSNMNPKTDFTATFFAQSRAPFWPVLLAESRTFRESLTLSDAFRRIYFGFTVLVRIRTSGRGRIRTYVEKLQQIYSLSLLTTRPLSPKRAT